MRIYLRVSTLAAGLIALGFLFPAIGVGQPAKTEAKGTVTAPAKPPMKVKVFKLERADPEAVVEGLDGLLEERDMLIPEIGQPGGVPPAPLGFGGAPAGFAGAPPMAPGNAPIGFGGGAAPKGFGGGVGFCGFAGGVDSNVVPLWRAATDVRTNAVVVRGSEKHLKIAADLVAILDRPANSPLPQLQIVKAFALKHANAEDLIQLIQNLKFEGVRLSSPEAKLVAVSGPDEATTAIAEIVKELDVPTKSDKK